MANENEKKIWEVMESRGHQSTERMKTFGGWIVRTSAYNDGVHMIFISDPNHEWNLDE